MSLISRTIYLPRNADESPCSTEVEVPNLFTGLSKQSFGYKFDTLRSLTPFLVRLASCLWGYLLFSVGSDQVTKLASQILGARRGLGRPATRSCSACTSATACGGATNGTQDSLYVTLAGHGHCVPAARVGPWVSREPISTLPV